MPLVTKNDIENIFASGSLYEKKSFFVIDSATLTYDTSKQFNSFLEQSRYLRDSFVTGHTLIVKNLENYNADIQKQAARYGLNVDVHMYLVPPNGSDSFDFHSDDSDVYANMVYGEKTFLLRHESDISYRLKAGDELYIPQGVLHKAIVNGPSCLLSFGVRNDVRYFVPGGVAIQDL